MKLSTGFLLVVIGQVLRLGAGMVVFVVLARWLGPTAFGQFAYWMAIATLLAVPVNFGFETSVLRSFGTRAAESATTMQDVLAAKLVLASCILLIALLALPLIGSTIERSLFLLLLFAQIFESFSEYYVLGFRVNAQYAKETVTASLVAVFHTITMVVAAYFWQDLLVVATAFAVSRLAGLFLTRYRCQLLIGHIPVGPVKRVGNTLKWAWAYALEMGLLTSYGQVDALIINHLLGPAAVGLYQAGMKLVQAASRLAPVLAQVVLPSLAKQSNDANAFRHMARRTLVIFLIVGLCGGAVLALFASFVTGLLFGNAYVELVPLLPMFGLLLFLRFAETGMGLLLVARGQQASKVWFVAMQLVLVVVAGTYALQTYGLVGWQLASVSSVGLLLFAYGWLLTRPSTHFAKGNTQ